MHLDERSAHLHGHGSDQRRRLRLHGQRGQRGRHRSELTGLGHGHPGHAFPARPPSSRPRRAMPRATVTWSAPSSDGGSAITAYTVVAGDETTPANGGESCTWTSGPLTCTVTGLTNGDAYVFTVSAANGVGTGPSSPASGTVTPATVPGAPTIVSATAGNARRRSPGPLRPLTAGQRSPPTRWWRATRPPRPTAVSRALGRAVRSPARSRV